MAALTFLPIGLDSSAWAYRADTADGAAYFVKVRRGIGNPAGLLIPRYLHDRGVTHVAAPIPTLARTLWADAGGFAVILYPFIDGATGTDHGMQKRHWVTYGAALRQIHDTGLVPELALRMRRETFTPAWRGVVERLDAHITAHTFADPSERDLAAFWRARRAQIWTLVERVETLGRRLRTATPPLVLCHADIHTWNVMIDTTDRFWVVDWDETMLAPKECDLMFVVGGLGAGLVGPHEEAWFFAGYGAAAVDPLALAYYRSVRAVDDLRAYAEVVFLMPEVGAATKRDALQGVMRLFHPGNLVTLAYESDRPET